MFLRIYLLTYLLKLQPLIDNANDVNRLISYNKQFIIY